MFQDDVKVGLIRLALALRANGVLRKRNQGAIPQGTSHPLGSPGTARGPTGPQGTLGKPQGPHASLGFPIQKHAKTCISVLALGAPSGTIVSPWRPLGPQWCFRGTRGTPAGLQGVVHFQDRLDAIFKKFIVCKPDPPLSFLWGVLWTQVPTLWKVS